MRVGSVSESDRFFLHYITVLLQLKASALEGVRLRAVSFYRFESFIKQFSKQLPSKHLLIEVDTDL